MLVLPLIALLSACGGGGGQTTPPPAAVSVALTPDTASARVTQTVQFTATVSNSTNTAVTWSLAGAGCSGATCGTISSTGLYTAPASVPSPATVTATATSAADASKSASATVTVLAAVVATVEWTWVSGSNVSRQPGIYGTQGVAAASNVPGSRTRAASWRDSSGNLWLFGGDGYDSAGTTGELNDLWKYDPAANQWTWVSGSNVADQAGTYGTQGVANLSNIPVARSEAVSWTRFQRQVLALRRIATNRPATATCSTTCGSTTRPRVNGPGCPAAAVSTRSASTAPRAPPTPANVPGARSAAVQLARFQRQSLALRGR